MSKELIIFGTAAFAEVVYWYFKEDSDYEVVAFTANESYIDRDEILGLPVVPFETLESNYPPDRYAMYVAVGYNKLNTAREKSYRAAKDKGYELVSYVYSGVRLWPNNKIGENTFIFEDNTIQPYVEIGNNVVLWSGNHIGHHSVVEDNVFISSHVVVSGFCKVGANSFIGVNSTMRDNMKVGSHNIIGAGALLVKDTDDYEVHIGTKATLFKKLEQED